MKTRSGNWYIGCSNVNRTVFQSSEDMHKIRDLLHAYQNEYIYNTWNLKKKY